MTIIERHIALEGASNLRDIGGYETVDGRQVRWGVVYRSGAMYRLADSAWEWMAERGIRAVCDLRSGEEREIAPTLWRGRDDTRHIGDAYEAELLFSALARSREAGVGEMGDALYSLLHKLLAPSFKVMFHALIEDHTPLIVHCSAGQDRTGLAIGLLLSAIGVPRDVIVEDYHLSTRYRRVENEMDHATLADLADSNVFARFYANVLEARGPAALTPRALVNRNGQSLLLDAFAAIEAEWGSIPAYLSGELELGDDGIARLQDVCLTDGARR